MYNVCCSITLDAVFLCSSISLWIDECILKHVVVHVYNSCLETAFFCANEQEITMTLWWHHDVIVQKKKFWKLSFDFLQKNVSPKFIALFYIICVFVSTVWNSLIFGDFGFFLLAINLRQISHHSHNISLMYI